MKSSDQNLAKSPSSLNTSSNYVFDEMANDFELERLLNSGVFEDYSEHSQTENWTDKLADGWLCIASDYSIQYKLMHPRFQSLHINNLATDLQRLKTVGEHKVVDITRCSYEVHEGQCIRVSVHAKLIFSLAS